MDDNDIKELSNFVTKIARSINVSRRKRKKSLRKHHFFKLAGERKQREIMEKKYCNDGLTKSELTEGEEVSLVEKRNEFFLAATSLNDHHISKIVDERTNLGLETVIEKETFIVSGASQWTEYVRETYTPDSGFLVVEYSESAGMIIDKESLCFIDYSSSSNSIDVKIYGDREFVRDIKNSLNKKFSVATCNIEWIYSNDGSSITIPLLGEKLPVSEMYPFLNGESVEEYYDRYLESSASILLLIGPPGTGKTTFIRGLLHYSEKNAIVTYDEKLIDKDYVFARFIEDDTDVMVLEDADNFLKSRKEGNSMMHRFLNVGDGLITVKGKKLVFSTNLPSVNDIDPALTRPGRCFDILHFDLYTQEQANALAKKLGVEVTTKKKDKYSLAEIFFEQRENKKSQSRMGFL